MSVPMQVQRAAEQVAAIEAQLYPPSEPVEQPYFEAVEPPPEPDPPPAPPPPAPPPPPPQPSDENWEHKYKTLQGVFNAKVPKLQDQLQQALDRIAQLEKAKPAEPPKKPEADPEDVVAFGADMVEMVTRVAEKMFGHVARQLDERITQLETTLNTTGNVVKHTAEQSFWAVFEQMVPDWREVNANEGFLAWLAEVDPISGVQRQELLDRALNGHDAQRLAAMFNVWKKLQAPPPPAPPTKPSMQEQVAPKAGGSPPPPSAPPVQIITSRQIERFYNEMAQGKFRGREKEAAVIEAQINQALAEGRVR